MYSCASAWQFEDFETFKTNKYKGWREQERQSLPGETLVIQTTWIYNRVHFTQESMCLVVEASNSSHSSCYFNVVSFESPWTKPKDFQKGLFWTAGAAHWPVNVTKQKSEHFASNQLFPNTPHCFGCGTVPGLLSLWSGCSDASNEGS